VDDELVHSEMSHAVHLAAGGESSPHLPRESLRLPYREHEALELNLARAATEIFCLGETVAVRLFARLRSGCEQPEAAAALDRILKDEVRHRDFGWSILDWCWTMPFRDDAAAMLHRELPGMFRRLQHIYCYGSLAEEAARAPSDAHWGMMPPSHYARALEETFSRDYQPLFARYDLDAEPAWAQATRPELA